MLDLMRRKKRLKSVLWLVIISLALGMLLLFVPGQNVGLSGVDSTAATVDGDEISMKEFSDSYRRLIDAYSAGGKNRLDPETLKALGVGRQALDSLISTRVVDYAAERMGLRVSPQEVRQAVENNPNLQDNGAFIGVERYKALLAANNIAVGDFEQGMRRMLLAQKLRNVVTDSLDVTERELRNEFARNNQEAQVAYVLLSGDDFRKKVAPTEAELQAYFEKNKEKYTLGEQRRAQYLLIDISSLADTVTVSDDEVKEAWDRQQRQETVDASHILFAVKDPAKDAEVKAKAEDVLKRAKAGEDFAELAKKFSEDPGSATQGGNLGPFQRGRMTKPFEDAAFALKPGEISGLVKTQFGYHIIKVLSHDIPDFENSRAGIKRNVQLEKAADLARQKSLDAERMAMEQKDLDAVAKSLNLKTPVRDTGWLSRKSDPVGAGISHPMLDEIFRLKEVNATGRAVEHPLGYAVPKLVEVKLAKPPEFAESKAAVERDYIETKSGEAAAAEAKRIADAAKAAGDLAKASQGAGLPVKTTPPFRRESAPDASIQPGSAFNDAAFDLPVGGVSGPIDLGAGNQYAVLQVKSRTPFDEAAYAKQKQEIRDRMLSTWRDSYFQEYIRQITEDLQKSGKIRVNPQAVDLVTTTARY